MDIKLGIFSKILLDCAHVALRKVHEVHLVFNILLVTLQIFEMMDAKARQDCIKEIDLLKVHFKHSCQI